MLELFGKKEDALKDYAAKEDWPGIAKAYYDLGKAAIKRGELEKAMLWLCRADTIYGASETLYEKGSRKRLFRKEIAEDCAECIGELEEADLLYNTVPEEVAEKAEELESSQLRMWDLLSAARLAVLGRRLGKLPGCAVLGELDRAVETVLRTLTVPFTQSDYDGLSNLSSRLYALNDSPAYYGGGEIEVPGGPAFQVFDLNGMTLLLNVFLFLDGYLESLAALSSGRQPPEPEESLAGCTLLLDYYVRTGAGKLEEVPQVQAELERIWDDYAFVRSNPAWEELASRVEQYLALDILQK